MATINIESIQKKLKEGIRNKIQRILTSDEFSKVEFLDSGDKLNWKAPRTIQEKILTGLKNDRDT